MPVDEGVALRVERHGADGRPVSGIARPARRVALACAKVQLMAGGQNRQVFAGVPLGRADVTDAAVAMIEVVPMHEASRPGPRLVEVGKAPGGELRTVLGDAEQRLGIGIVVTHARPGVRGLDGGY